MPKLIEPSRPNGLPMASTNCPTLTLLESPTLIGCNLTAFESTLMTARSLSGSTPTTVAGTLVPSAKVTTTFCALSTT